MKTIVVMLAVMLATVASAQELTFNESGLAIDGEEISVKELLENTKVLDKGLHKKFKRVARRLKWVDDSWDAYSWAFYGVGLGWYGQARSISDRKFSLAVCGVGLIGTLHQDFRHNKTTRLLREAVEEYNALVLKIP